MQQLLPVWVAVGELLILVFQMQSQALLVVAGSMHRDFAFSLSADILAGDSKMMVIETREEHQWHPPDSNHNKNLQVQLLLLRLRLLLLLLLLLGLRQSQIATVTVVSMRLQ